MKLIDPNGRILGRVNIADLVLMLLTLVVVAALTATALFPDRALKQIRRMPRQQEALVTIVLGKERSWLANSIVVGDGQKDLENRFTAEIIDLKKRPMGGEADAVTVTMRLKAMKDESGLLVYGGRILRPGEEFLLETRKCLIKGLISEVVEN